MPGLVQCSQISDQWCILYTFTYCSKLVEALLAALLMSGSLAEIIITIKMQGTLLVNTKFFIELFIFLSLLFDLVHSIDGSQGLSIMLFLRLFFTNLFLLTIFYYVGDNILKSRQARVALHVFYVLMTAFYVGILILREINKSNCIELREIYLIMDCISVFISLLIFVLYCIKSREEKKMHLFYTETLVSISSSSPVNYSQPFCRMWILISTNFFCGAVNFVQTTYLFATSKCKFSQDLNTNTLINFIFLLFDYYLGSLVALLVLRKIRMAQTQNQEITIQRSQSFSNQIAEANKLQMIANMSSRSSTM